MKDLLKFLPQILAIIPSIMGNLKSLVILVLVVSVLGGIGYSIYYYMSTMYRDPYKCVNGEIYKQIDFNSDVYVFKGGYCVESKK